MERIDACVGAGLNVLADKPWLIEAADFPKLEKALAAAERKGLVAYDVMTERYEVTTVLQRDIAADREVTGTVGPGTEKEPAIEMESVHHIMKIVAGAPNLRPAWFFDTAEQGEGLGDVATHLVDLVPFVLFPGQPIDHRADVRVLAARRWPTALGRAELLRVTGLRELPAALSARLAADKLDYYANGEVSWTVKGVHARAKVLWNYEAPAGAGDTHTAVVRGSRARVEIRQGADERWRPELYVVPSQAAEAAAVRAALDRRVAALAREWRGLTVEPAGSGFRVAVPDEHRVGHEAHFAEVTRRFLGYLKDPASLPRWERANMLAKYHVTTRAVELSRKP
jgi:predicted dehydrogenase